MSPINPPDNGRREAAPRRQLTLLDSTSIIVGIIIGSAIYEMTPIIAGCVPNAACLVGVWVLGGLLSLVGALCYAELATAYPREGGDYVYLTRAFGRTAGFLFAWAQFWIVRPGSIGALAYVFARYANELWPLGDEKQALVVYAAGSIIILSGINILGVREGKWTQNFLTAVKVVGLAGVVVAGLCFAAPPALGAAAAMPEKSDFRQAMILVLFAYGGWNEMAYVGAEVRRPEKNILRALLLGTAAVTLLYVAVNLAFVHALGFGGTRHATAVAADVLQLALGPWGRWLISLLVCISALGFINGMIFTGARIYYAMGTEHRLYAWLGRWSPRWQTPAWSLVIQAAVTLLLVVGFGLSRSGLELRQSGFQRMVNFTTPVFWIFFLLVGMTLFVLRRREPDTTRPYRVPWYPLVPLVFCLSSLFMVYSSISWACHNCKYEALWSVGILIVGVAASYFDNSSSAAAKAP
jgi:amino acid transporter